jgi:anti-anti-sigma factor
MSVSISWRRSDFFLFGDVRGRIDSPSSATFHNLISSEIKPDDLSLILDFSRVSFISSAGLRILLIVAKEYAASEKLFGLCSLPSIVQEVMGVSGFKRVVRIFDSLDESLQEIGIELPVEKDGSPDVDEKESSDSPRFLDAFSQNILTERFIDVARYSIQKYENETDEKLSPEVQEQAIREIEVELAEIREEIRRKIWGYRMKIFYASDIKLRKFLDK